MGIWLPCLAGSTTTSQRNQHDSIHTSLDVSHDGRSPSSVYPGSGVRAPESNLISLKKVSKPLEDLKCSKLQQITKICELLRTCDIRRKMWNPEVLERFKALSNKVLIAALGVDI